MKLARGHHLAYCTNIHRGETWEETFASLEKYTLAVKRAVAPREPYAIGLRLGSGAARSLMDSRTRTDFQRWMERHDCYVFTINGFPYGQFHGTRVKEQVYLPDWSSQDRVDYTEALFNILSDILPAGVQGSVSTLPGSFKEFTAADPALEKRIRKNLLEFAGFTARLGDRTGQDLHLGLEPEPLGWFETSEETIQFIQSLGAGEEIRRCLGVNYDTCHLAVEYEDPARALKNFQDAGVRISKLHLSSALQLEPTGRALQRLEAFADDTYLHQVVARHEDGSIQRFRDLAPALEWARTARGGPGLEWRVHFHVPLHGDLEMVFGDTKDHLLGVLDVLKDAPSLCEHLEMETYTWEVLPGNLRSDSVVDQLVKEYDWCLTELGKRGLA